MEADAPDKIPTQIKLSHVVDQYIDILDQVRVRKVEQVQCPTCCGDCDNPFTGEVKKCPSCKGTGKVLINDLEKIKEYYRGEMRKCLGDAKSGVTPGGHVLVMTDIEGGAYTKKASRKLAIDPVIKED